MDQNKGTLDMSNLFRRIPSVNELLESEPLKRLAKRASRTVVVSGVREFLARVREEVSTAAAEVPSPSELAERIAEWIARAEQPALRPVINAPGVLLHTGLGRAPLPDEARQAVSEVTAGYASVEIDLGSGKRSQRMDVVDRTLKQLTDCEASAVVNNNAGATLIVLAALAAGKEVVVSRGQLVEIGGSFRLPDVMQQGQVRLREVGTTNKTRVSDYEAAIGEETGAILRVHPSNYVIRGFTESVGLEELVALGRRHGVPVIDDIGSGGLWDFTRYGIKGEPLVKESIAKGADVVLFSGDKLLGGPQCGILLGKRVWIEKIRRHPLARALRVDKMTLAALYATLQLYLDPETAEQRLPLLRLLATPLENLRHRAEHLAPQIEALSHVASAQVVEETAYLGGGSVPTQELPTVCVAVVPAEGKVDELAGKLRTAVPAVMGRVRNDQLLIDLRTVFAEQDVQVVEAFKSLEKSSGSGS